MISLRTTLQSPTATDPPDDLEDNLWMGMYAIPIGGYAMVPSDLLIESYVCLGCGKDIDKADNFISSGKFLFHVDCFTKEVQEDKVPVNRTYSDDAGGE